MTRRSKLAAPGQKPGGWKVEKQLHGCGTALVTPFTATGAVDEGALRSLVDWQIDEGIHFLVPCGSTGEAGARGLSASVTDAGPPEKMTPFGWSRSNASSLALNGAISQ